MSQIGDRTYPGTVTDQQILTIALASVPTTLAVLVGILVNNSRLGDLRSHMDGRFADVDRRLAEMDRKMDVRFGDIKDTWRAELRRVEEVLDPRLKHIEER